VQATESSLFQRFSLSGAQSNASTDFSLGRRILGGRQVSAASSNYLSQPLEPADDGFINR
jgi:hypothetical protein